jgi:hypothetical protein
VYRGQYCQQRQQQQQQRRPNNNDDNNNNDDDNNPKTVCNSVQMQTTLETMGYTIWSNLPQNGGLEFTGKPFKDLPSDVNFVQQFRDQTPRSG